MFCCVFQLVTCSCLWSGQHGLEVSRNACFSCLFAWLTWLRECGDDASISVGPTAQAICRTSHGTYKIPNCTSSITTTLTRWGGLFTKSCVFYLIIFISISIWTLTAFLLCSFDIFKWKEKLSTDIEKWVIFVWLSFYFILRKVYLRMIIAWNEK